MQLYVKDCNNVRGGMPLTSFTELGPIWQGESLIIPIGPDRKAQQVCGWSDLFFGSPCSISCAQVRAPQGERGYLVWGGNQGIRIYQDAPGDGYGQAVLWIEEAADLPAEVQQVCG